MASAISPKGLENADRWWRPAGDLLKDECQQAPAGAVAKIGLVGHAGIGHAHGLFGMVQDDSAGFTCIISLLRSVFPVDLRVSSVRADPVAGNIAVTTNSGGVGEAWPRRGVTPQENVLLQRAIGHDASFCQSLASHVFGRVYGQGAMECSVCLEAAAAFAVLDSFRKVWPDAVHIQQILHDDNLDAALGAVLEIAGEVTALLAVVNFTSGGLGPNENAEGNIPLGEKRNIMHFLGLQGIPNIVVESKAFIPACCENLDKRTLFTRLNRNVDNVVVAQALVEGASKAGLRMQHDFQAYPRDRALRQSTTAFGAEVQAIGQALLQAKSSQEKVRLTAKLAKLTSEDAGAITFMSESIHAWAGGAGLVPGSSAVLSMLAPRSEIEYWKIPILFEEDLEMYISSIISGINCLKQCLPEAMQELHNKQCLVEKQDLACCT